MARSGDFEKDYFDQQYRDYRKQNPPRKLDFYRKLAESAAGSVKAPRILDIGCAFGSFLAHLDARWLKFGLDASVYAIQQAREQLRAAKLAVARSGEIPFSGPFEVVTAFDVLEHVRELATLLDLISERLEPGGALVFVVPVYDGPTGPLIRALDRDPTHVHKKGRDFWLGIGGNHFRLNRWWGIYRYLLPTGFYVHIVTQRWRRFTPAIACTLERL